MNLKQHDAGIIQALLARFEQQRLPYLLSLEKLCNTNHRLSNSDLDFLKIAIEDTTRIMPIVERNAEYFSLVTKIISLYLDITTQALQLEEKIKNKK